MINEDSEHPELYLTDKIMLNIHYSPIVGKDLA